MKNTITAILLVICSVITTAPAAMAEGVQHHVAIHIDQNDPKLMNLALNNVENITKYYVSQGDTVVIEVVAYGPGLSMYIPEKSPVADRIETLSLALEHVSFSACGNTRRKMSEKLGHEVAIMEEATIVPSGVVRLIELQEQGYAYVRP